MRNWKTTLSGLSAILGGIVMIAKGDINGGVTAIIGGIGLVFSKDYDVRN